MNRDRAGRTPRAVSPERALSGSLVRSILSQADAAVVVRAPSTGKLLYANEQAGALAVPPADLEGIREALGRSLFVRARDGRPYRFDRLPVVRAILQGEVVRAEALFVRTAGSGWRFVEVRCTPLRRPDGSMEAVTVVAVDRTEARRMRNQLRKFQLLSENTGDVQLLLDSRGTVEYANRAACVVLQMDRDALQGMRLPDPAFGPELPEFGTLFAMAQRGPVPPFESRLRRRRGGDLPVEVALTGVRLRSGPRLFLTMRDLRERKRLESRLRSRAAQLARADREKDEFIATLAHELRNPLAPVTNALWLLQQGNLAPPDRRRVQEIVARQVGHMARLLEDLLDVTRIARGKVVLRPESTLASDVVGAAAETVRDLVREKRQILREDVPEEPLVFRADAGRCVQILSNLLQNAAKFTPPGGAITVSVSREHAYVVFRVRDTGRGIPREDLPRIFERFYQGRGEAATQGGGGLGLGLALVRKLVERHHGMVGATSPGPGQGSEFEVRLPAAGPREEDHETMAQAARTADREERMPGLRILVVDDYPDALRLLAMVLATEGHEVVSAATGPDALREADAFRPEVVLLDIGLPEMDGYEVAERMGDAPWRKDAVLVALTGYGQEEDRRRAAEAGFDHHLVKPVQPDSLRDLLRSVLARRGAGGSGHGSA